jgi:hypothetical protein
MPLATLLNRVFGVAGGLRGSTRQASAATPVNAILHYEIDSVGAFNAALERDLAGRPVAALTYLMPTAGAALVAADCLLVYTLRSAWQIVDWDFLGRGLNPRADEPYSIGSLGQAASP